MAEMELLGIVYFALVIYGLIKYGKYLFKDGWDDWWESEPDFTYKNEISEPIYRYFPGCTEHVVCPVDECETKTPMRVYSVIIHLNDKHYWAREAVADWLDTLEIDLTIADTENS